MTGHKDLKLADHYSKLDTEFQKEVSEKIMKHIKQSDKNVPSDGDKKGNVITIDFKRNKSKN